MKAMTQLTLVACLWFYSTSLLAQEYKFIYFDKPEVISKNFTTTVSSDEPGFAAVSINSTNLTAFNRVAPPGLRAFYQKINDKNSTLRKAADRLTSLSKASIKTIEFRIINDVNGLTGTVRKLFCRRYKEKDDKLIPVAWPCASNKNNNLGYVMFGEWATKNTYFEGTVLHELSHTQSLANPEGFNSKHGNIEGYLRIAYGGDAGHYGNELQGDEQAPMDEAFGNFWAGLHQPDLSNYLIANFNSAQPYLLGSHSNLTGWPDMWNAKHKVLVSATVPYKQAGQAHPTFNVGGYQLELVSDHLVPGSSRYEARLYQFIDVPKNYLYYSEATTELYLTMLHRYAYQSRDTALVKIIDYAKYYVQQSKWQRHRYPSKLAVYFARSMENYYKAAYAKGRTQQEKIASSIFPLALYDLLMHFGPSDADLAREFEVATYTIPEVPQIIKPKAVDWYLSHRKEVKELMCPYISGNKECSVAKTSAMDIENAVQVLRTYCLTVNIWK
jgi:hypothetical protein